MRKTLLLVLIAFLLFYAGCSGVGQEVIAGVRPEKHWEGTWKIEGLESRVEFIDGQAVVEGFCLIKYRGEKPAEDVRIIINSPLMQNVITGELATEFGTIQPGDEFEYHLNYKSASWQENVPVGLSEDKLGDDFFLNSYVEVAWKYDPDEFDVVFYDWKSAEI